MKEFIVLIAKSLVDKPDEVDLQEVTGERTTVLNSGWPRTTLARSSASRVKPLGPFEPS